MRQENHPIKQTAMVLEIQRMSTEDGPGIRTTVFFKGCGLRCVWCHNPESLSQQPQIQWIGSRCIGCKTCVEACPNQAITLAAEGIRRMTDLCRECGTCTEICPSTAMERIGTVWGMDDLIKEVLKDKSYYETSEGGVTASGGDPTLQAAFVADFFKRLKAKGIHTALDTCGLCSKAALEQILPYTDMILYDVKLADNKDHRAYTGASNERILENLVYVHRYMQNHLRPNQLWVRTPVIPDTTDSPANIRGIGKFIAERLKSRIDRWELCAFNNLCKDKYLRLHLDWPYKDCELLDEAFMVALAETAKTTGVDPNIVHWSGSTRLKNDDSIDKKAGTGAP